MARRQIALDHQRKVLARAEQLHAALDVPARAPASVRLHLFVGDAQPTPAVMKVDDVSGALSVALRAPGDDTVLRSSAVMDERIGRSSEWAPGLVSPIDWADVTFVFTDHLAMTRDPTFTDNILYRLLDAPRPHASASIESPGATGTHTTDDEAPR